MNDHTHQTAPKGSDNYYALLRLAPEKKTAIAAILNLFNALMNALFAVSDDSVAKAKLSWWQHELHESTHGNPSHPITQSFQQQKLDLLPFQKITDELLALLGYCHFDTFEDLMIIIINTFGAREKAIAALFDIDTTAHQEPIYQSAMVFALSYFAKNARQHLQHAFFFFPDNELKQCHVSRQDLLQLKTNTGIAELIKLQHEKIKNVPPFKLCQPIYRRHLLEQQWWQAVQSEQYRLLEQKIIIPPIRKLFFLWRNP